MATGGFGTRITTETPEKLKAALGGVSYIIHGLMRMDTLKPDRCEIKGEDFHWQGDALVIGMGNGRQQAADSSYARTPSLMTACCNCAFSRAMRSCPRCSPLSPSRKTIRISLTVNRPV
jgi:diacylglycerol kinase family enzyme